ncbi:50S ribosomal protein L22 [Candidatus Woesearchaeota archaeon]|nr:50S ribosomal protein L22 [Candidatus Woesearchaeota archaeon]
MTRYNYAFKTEKENVVKTVGRDLNLSPKQAIEICKFINGKEVAKAKGILEKVKEKKLAVPFTRATNGAGHKPGMSAGKYPFKGSIEFLQLLKQLEANAQNKGLSSNLIIIHACAQRASEPFKYGRKRRVQMKRCHVELAAQEFEQKKAKAKKASKPKESKEPKKADNDQTNTQTNA